MTQRNQRSIQDLIFEAFAILNEELDKANAAQDPQLPQIAPAVPDVQPVKTVKVSKATQAVAIILSEIVNDPEILDQVSQRELGKIALAMTGGYEEILAAVDIIRDFDIVTDKIDEYTQVLFEHINE